MQCDPIVTCENFAGSAGVGCIGIIQERRMKKSGPIDQYPEKRQDQ
jgi:uncharacterized membrane protein YjjB (DUF3815 family)